MNNKSDNIIRRVYKRWKTNVRTEAHHRGPAMWELLPPSPTGERLLCPTLAVKWGGAKWLPFPAAAEVNPVLARTRTLPTPYSIPPTSCPESHTFQLVCSHFFLFPEAPDWYIWSSPYSLSMVVGSIQSFGSQCFKIQHYRLFLHKNQISLRYTCCLPIPLHYSSSPPRSLSKNVDEFAYPMGWVSPLLGEGLTQTVFPNTFFICTTGI